MDNNYICISINLDNLGFNDKLSPMLVDAIQNSIQTSLALIKDKWEVEARSKLNSTREIYLSGLSWEYPDKNNIFSGTLSLKGKLPNMIEDGFPSFDQKIGFSNSNKAIKKTNGGWYLTIPLRHGTPKSYFFSSTMTNSIYREASKLANNQSLHYPGIGDTSWNGYVRKHNKFDGLTRIVKSYNNTTQSQYYTFRRVSNNSDPKSWMHPGYSGAKITETIEKYSRETFNTILTNNLNKFN